MNKTESPAKGTMGTRWPAHVDPEFIETLRRFVRARVTPMADEIDREDIYPVDIIRQIAAEGYTTVTLPAQYGGAAKDFDHAAALLEELAYGSASAAICLITIFQAATIIRLFGCDSLKDTWLPRFRHGLLASYALTEAKHGSDIRRLDTKARKAGNEWVISGEKQFVTGGVAAELFVILAQTDAGVSAFAVPADAPGLTRYAGERSATFGLRNGPHVNIRLKDVRVPIDHLIGVDGKGVRQAVTTLNFSRTLAAAISIGIARAAFDSALDHAKARIAFDSRVADFQGIQWYFADMLTSIDAARLLVYRATQALDEGLDIDRFGSEAKLLASTMATEVASKAVGIAGVYGVSVNSSFGRYLRDAKAYEVAGGSVEILRNTIAKNLLRGEVTA